MDNWETFPSISFQGVGEWWEWSPAKNSSQVPIQQNFQEQYNDLLHLYTKLKPIRTGWNWSSGSEDLETGVSLRGPVLDFSREIKMPFFEVLAHFVLIRLNFLSQLKASSPLTGGLGARMMKKMGWKDGEGLGKDRWEANIPQRGPVKYSAVGPKIYPKCFLKHPKMPRNI